VLTSIVIRCGVYQEHAIDAIRQANVGCADDSEETQGVHCSRTDEVDTFMPTLWRILSQKH